MEAIPEVWPVTTPVAVGTIEGVVLRIQIAAGPNVVYEVGWWTAAGEWKESWFNSFMVKSEHAKEKIGYMLAPKL